MELILNQDHITMIRKLVKVDKFNFYNTQALAVMVASHFKEYAKDLQALERDIARIIFT